MLHISEDGMIIKHYSNYFSQVQLSSLMYKSVK